MAKEIIISADSEQEALEQAYAQLGAASHQCDVQVLQPAKKGLFGKLKQQAKVKVTVVRDANDALLVEEESTSEAEPAEEAVEEAPASGEENQAKLDAAQTYLRSILDKMGMEDVRMSTQMNEESATITLDGENLGILIGRHGETLDALQHLTTLMCNRLDGKYFRITLDCGQYRDKRQKTLQEMARRVSQKVARTGRSQMLEPMNPYERRIVHSVVVEMDGVTSKSKGEDPNRRVIILPTNPRSRNSSRSGGYDRRRDDRRGGYRRSDRGRSDYTFERVSTEDSMEKILKAERTEEEKTAKRYSKIEF